MTEGKIVKNLVCGMVVNVTSTPPKTRYKWVEQYFCAPGCLKQFEKNPETFVHDAKETFETHGHHDEEGYYCGGGRQHHHNGDYCCSGQYQ